MEKPEYINTDNSVVDITKVKPNEYNPKLSVDEDEHNHYEFEKIKESLQKVGQIQPVLVRELADGTYEIINGYHRHRAMTELGFSQIEIKNLGKIDFDTAVSRALLTEETKVPIDNVELSHLLKSIVTPEKPIEYWAEILPYTPNLIQQKIEMVDFDFGAYNNNDDEDEEEKSPLIDFNFKVSDEQTREMCKKVISTAADDKNDAFVAICKYYAENR